MVAFRRLRMDRLAWAGLISFNESNIYDINDAGFGSDPEFEVTEIGLIPRITKCFPSSQ